MLEIRGSRKREETDRDRNERCQLMDSEKGKER